MPERCQSCHFDRLWRWWCSSHQQNRLKNKCSSFPSPHENVPILSRLVNTLASVICVSFLTLLATVTGFVCQDKSQDEETTQERRGLIRSFQICQRRNTGSLSDFLSWLSFHWCRIPKNHLFHLSYWLSYNTN